MRVALRNGLGQYVSAVNGGGDRMAADRAQQGSDERLTLTRESGDIVSLRARNGLYLTVGHPNGEVRATSPTRTMEAAFQLIDLNNGRYAIQIHRRHWYLRGGATLTIGKGPIRPEDEFELVELPVAWMEENFEAINNKTMAELCLPGTHDAGAYELFDELAPDATDAVRTLWNQAHVGGATRIREFVKGMAITQTKNFYQQLEAGIRYLDLRICQMNGRYYTCHTLRGHSLETLMRDVRRFLDENPREVVVFKVGFKGPVNRDGAWAEIARIVGRDTYRPTGVQLRRHRFSELVDPAAPKRAIFVLDTEIQGIWDGRIFTNAAVLDNLQRSTANFAGNIPLEAQCMRPVSTEDFVRSYIQLHGCRLLPVFAALAPFFGLAGLGLTALPAYLAYVRNFQPLPTDLVQNARDSRSIFRDYIRWLAENPRVRPQMIHADFIEELPMVEVCICISTGQSFQHLVGGVADVRPQVPVGDRLMIFNCSAQAIASAFQMLGYAIDVAGTWIKDNLGLLAGPLNTVLRAAGYVAQAIVAFFNTLDGEFRRFFQNLGQVLDPRRWVRRRTVEDGPRSTAEVFLDRLEDDEFREGLLPAFADVEPGDWRAAAEIARSQGYEMSPEELRRAVPDSFFEEGGEALGWQRTPLPA